MPDIRVLTAGELAVLERLATRARRDGKVMRVCWDRGLMVKVGGGVWTYPLGSGVED